ncbi:TlpA family protein disulfide reductase [Leeuwenhoekiella sp. H156]|uniref:TlpA family protein disulfide reductase n=1 Tax=Leeuwenhoekiella sp. H156 TaxID=3450128 RepID=UPI003FA45D21
MKINNYNLVFLLFFSVASLCHGQVSSKAIDNPSYEVTTSGITHVSRIERTPEETRVTIHSKFIPGWWVNFTKDTYLRDVATDKKYRIKEVIGAQFDEKLWTPESGEQFTELIFEPLPLSTQKIDYVDASKTIFGISLIQTDSQTRKEVPSEVMTWLKQEVAKSDPALESFDSDSFFSRKMGRVVGYIKGYDPRLGFETGMIYIGNELTREEYPTVIEIAPDGRFEAEIPLVHPTETFFVIYKKNFTIYLEPGTTLGLIIDWEEFLLADRYRDRRYELENIEFYGPLAQINKELRTFKPERFDYGKDFPNLVKTLPPLDFKAEVLKQYHTNEEKLAAYLSENSITQKAQDLSRINIKLISSSDLFDYVSNRTYYKTQDTTNVVLKMEVPDSYYQDIQDLLPVNEPGALATNQYKVLINRLEYADPLQEVDRNSQRAKYRQSEKTLQEYFDEEGIVLEDKFKEYLKPKSEDEISKLDSLELRKLSKEFNEKYFVELQNFSKKYTEPLPKDKAPIELEKWKQKDSLLVNFFGVEKGLASDIIKVRSLKFWFDFWGKETSDLVWTNLKKDIDNPFLKAEGQRMYDQIYPQVSDNEELVDGDLPASEVFKENTLVLPEGKGTTAFRKITDSFKGKILFVDFWATSCGPCVATIKHMKETRKKYKDNPDFEFVFITDESQSPQKTYDKFIAEQELEHVYRVDQSTYHRFRDLFSFNGIPQYIVLDKAGNVVDADFKMYAFDFELPKILKKYK